MLKDRYVILNTRDTIGLCRWATSEGFVVWTPSYMGWTTYKEKGQVKRRRERKLEQPGYIFGPLPQWPSLRRAAPLQYNLRPFGYDGLARPYCCDLTELEAWDAAIQKKYEILDRLNEDQEEGDVIIEEVLSEGAHIIITMGPFKNRQGVVAKGGSNKRYRVNLNGFHINLPKSWVKGLA